jgi:hypothetical protein
MDKDSFKILTRDLKLNCKNLEILSLKGIQINDKSILFFLQEIQFERFPRLKILDLSDVDGLSTNSLKVINQLIITKKISVIVTPSDINNLNYFNVLHNEKKKVSLESRGTVFYFHNLVGVDYDVFEFISIGKTINQLEIVKSFSFHLKTGILTQELEKEINEYIIDLEFIESLRLNLHSKGDETKEFWPNIIFQYLKSFEVNLSFAVDLEELIIYLPYTLVKNLTLNILPISNYFDFLDRLNKMKFGKFGINITENAENCVLKAVSEMNFERLELFSNNYLHNDEYEFLVEMLRNNSKIIDFNFFYQKRLLNCYPSLQEIAKMNKIKCQIQTQFQYLKRIPGDLNFHFGIERNFSLEEKPAKKMKFK